MKMSWIKSARLWRWLFYLPAGLVLFYALLGFIGGPLALRWVLRQKVAPMINHPLHVGAVYLNPFTLRLRISDLEITEPGSGSGRQLVAWQGLDVDVSFLALLKKTLRVERLVVDQPYVNVVIAPDGVLNLLALVPQPPAGEDEPSESEEAASAGSSDEAAPAAPPAVVIVDALQINQGTIAVADQTLSHPFQQVLRPLDVHLEHLSTRPDDAGGFLMDMSLAGGRVALTGRVTLEPLTARVTLLADQVEVARLQPYLAPYARVVLRDGRLRAGVRLSYDSTDGHPDGLTVDADLGISRLRVEDTRDRLLAGWDDLTISPVHLSLARQEVTVGRIRIDGLDGQFILTDTGTNIDAVLPPAAGAPAADQGESSPVPGTEPEAPAAPENALPWQVALEEFALQNARFSLKDVTLPQPFQLTLDQGELSVTGLTTRPDAQVKWQLSLRMAGRGRLTSSGQVRPFTTPLDVEAQLAIQDYDMTGLSPYVGRFTGYAAADGRMDLNIDYHIADQAIDAHHKLLVQHFDFGRRVESDQALKLPFKLALSLLEDARGRITITLPVTGDLADPNFKYAHLIGQTLANYLVKAVTKPFTFLLSAVGGGADGEEELNLVYFDPGRADLPEAEQANLQKLLIGLQDHPRLILTVQGGYDTTDDWWAIKTRSFEQDYQAMQREYERPPGWIIKKLHQKNFGLPAYRQQRRDFTLRQRSAEGAALTEADFVEILRHQLIEEAPADRAALGRLAEQRAATVVNFLAGPDGLDPSRVRTLPGKEMQSHLDRIPTELSLTVWEEEGGDPPVDETGN